MSKESNPTDEDLPKSLQKLSLGSAQTLTGKLFSRVARFLFQILLTRTLATSVYGVYVIGWTVFRILREVTTGGISRFVFRFGGEAYGVNNNSKLKGILMLAVYVSVCTGIVGAIGLYLTAGWVATTVFNKPSSAFIIRLLAPSLPVFSLLFVTTAALRVIDQVDKYVIVDQVLQPTALIGLTGIGFLFGYRLDGIAFGVAGSVVVAATLGLYFLSTHVPFAWRETKTAYDSFQSYLTYSSIAVLIALLVLLLNSIDRLMLGYFFDSETVGIYNVAAVIGAIASLLLGVTNSVFPPIISRLNSQGKTDELRNVFQTQSYWVFALTLPGYGVFVILGPELLGLFGSQYTVGYSLLLIVGLGHVINSGTGSSGSLLSMVGFQHFEVVNLMVANAVNFTLNFVLIQEYGAIGAAAATAASLGGMHLLKAIECYYFADIFPITPLHLLAAGMATVLLGGYATLPSSVIDTTVGRVVALFCFFVIYLGMFFAIEYRKGRIQIFTSLLTRRE